MNVFLVFTKEIFKGLLPYIFKELSYSSNEKSIIDHIEIKKNKTLINHIQIKEENPEVEFIKWVSVFDDKNINMNIEKKYNLKKIYEKYDNKHSNSNEYYNNQLKEYDIYKET